MTKRFSNWKYPNIKEGKGGLRDLQTLYWITKYLYKTFFSPSYSYITIIVYKANISRSKQLIIFIFKCKSCASYPISS